MTTPPRLLLFVSILLLPIISVWATWNYEYGPDEYVTIAKGISPDGKIAITAHGSGELGDEHFHLYLTDGAPAKRSGRSRRSTSSSIPLRMRFWRSGRAMASR